ncbi:MAG TPA: hypothetical protein VK666_01105 [Chryseolinea sp.]|nr:hypothetical protein [Chryseolinea sp.]
MKNMTRVIIAILVMGFVHAFGQNPTRGSRIFISRDSGINWEKLDSGFPDDGINAWVFKDETLFVGTDMNGVWTSSDQGKHWYASGKGLPHEARIISMVAYADLVWAGTFRHGLYFTADNGAHWSHSSLPVANASIRSLFAVKGTFLVGTDIGMYKSTDVGKTWGEHIQIQGAEPHCLDRSQINEIRSIDNDLYAATSHGAMTSKDLGKTWQYIFHNKAIQSIAGDKREITLLDFSGTVYRSTRYEICWLMVDKFLPFPAYFKLTPASPKLLKHGWEGMLIHTPTYRSGLPQDIPFGKILPAPFGLLVASYGDGC